MQFVYVILLPDEVHNFMRSVQAALYERYDASHRTLVLEPHVTIKQPFEADDAERHEAYLEQLARETTPFEMVMRGYGFFEEEGVVFLDVEQNPRLLALQHDLLDALGLEPGMYESDEPVPYYFHGTLAAGLSADDLADARTRVGDTPEFRFPLARFGLFRSTEETWRLYRRVKLAQA